MRKLNIEKYLEKKPRFVLNYIEVISITVQLSLYTTQGEKYFFQINHI